MHNKPNEQLFSHTCGHSATPSNTFYTTGERNSRHEQAKHVTVKSFFTCFVPEITTQNKKQSGQLTADFTAR